MSDRAQLILGEIRDALDRKRRLPVVRPADAEAGCRQFHAEVDRGTAARATAAAAAGHLVACHDGCSQCCNNIPAVFAGEVVTIVRWLDRPENAVARAGFLARYPAWFARVADLIAGWDAATAARDVDGATAMALVEPRRTSSPSRRRRRSAPMTTPSVRSPPTTATRASKPRSGRGA